jgi:hypothetical protein
LQEVKEERRKALNRIFSAFFYNEP